MTSWLILTFDDLSLYRYFLIPGNKFEEVFVGEKMPNFDYLKHEHDELKDDSVREGVKEEFLSSIPLNKEKLIELITRVRYCEGYGPESIDKTISDMIKLNKLNKDSLNITKG